MIECVHIFIPCLITQVMSSGRYSQAGGGVPGRGQALSGIGFLGRRPLVPVGAGVVMGWVGTLAVALASVDGRTKGDRKGCRLPRRPSPTPHPNLSRPYGVEVMTSFEYRADCDNTARSICYNPT